MVENKTVAQSGLLAQAKHYWLIVLKWKWSALIFFLIVVMTAVIYISSVAPIYTAKGSIWIEDEPNILPFAEIQSLGSGANLPSQTRLLQSRALAAETIEKLKLYEKTQFAKTDAAGTISFAAMDPIFRNNLIEGFLKSLVVTQIGGTSLVDVQFANRDPKIAADTINALFDGFMTMISRKRFSDSEQATEFLNTQITSLRKEIEEREKALNIYGSEKNILPPTAAEAPTVTRLSEFNKALTNATIERINRFNHYNQIKSAPLGEIPDAPPGSFIQTLRTQYLTLSREYAKRLTTIRPEYPEMQRLKSELDAATEALQNETQNLVRVALLDYEASLRKEQSFQKQLDDLKTDAFKSNSNSIQYNNLRIELTNKKALLESLTKRQSEADVSSQLKGLKAINVWVVDKADPPLKPTFPKKTKILLFAFFAALGGAACLAFVLENMTQTVKTSKDVLKATNLGTLGVIPSFGKVSNWKRSKTERARFVALLRGGGAKAERNKPDRPAAMDKMGRGEASNPNHPPANTLTKIELIAHDMPHSIQAESFRSIRTSLLISSRLQKTNAILLTSALAKEGKSSVVSNLALVLSMGGKKVVVVDADLRKPKQHKIFGASGGDGLTHFLGSKIDIWQVITPTQFPNLSLVKCGPIPENPIELLTSERMGELVGMLKKSFDYVFFDTPPVLAVSDALALGPMVDGAIIVVRGEQTPIPALRQAKEKIDVHKINCLGVILNDADLIEEDGYYAREYYHYSERHYYIK